jgi:hypothetical protein
MSIYDYDVPTSEVCPVPLAEAARLARLPADVLLLVAEGGAIGFLFTPHGPMFDPVECLGLGYIADGMDDRAKVDGGAPW